MRGRLARTIALTEAMALSPGWHVVMMMIRLVAMLLATVGVVTVTVLLVAVSREMRRYDLPSGGSHGVLKVGQKPPGGAHTTRARP
jgi:hypothetical protein